MVWDGIERRGVTDTSLLADDIEALHATVKEMHRQNAEGFEERGRTLDTRFDQVNEGLHKLALAVQAADSRLATEVAVHIASAHHVGTAQRLNEHETRLNEHGEAIGKLKQRLQHDEGHREAQTEVRELKYVKWGLAGTLLIGVGTVLSQVLGAALQAWASLTAGGGHPR